MNYDAKVVTKFIDEQTSHEMAEIGLACTRPPGESLVDDPNIYLIMYTVSLCIAQ